MFWEAFYVGYDMNASLYHLFCIKSYNNERDSCLFIDIFITLHPNRF